MPRNNHTFPLAFALAVAIDAGNANVDVLRADAALKPGSLADLLGTLERNLPDKSKGQPSRLGDQFDQAQWSNFPNFPNFSNCFSGNWRNC